MIKDLLTMLFIRKQNLYEIAGKLNISPDDVYSRLEIIEHIGYVKRSNIQKFSCKESCPSCTFLMSCPGTDQSGSSEVKGYDLTAKGRKLLENVK